VDFFFPSVVWGKWKIIISLGKKNRPFSFLEVFIFIYFVFILFYLFLFFWNGVETNKNTMYKKLFYENSSFSSITYSSVLLFRWAHKTWLFIHNKITSNDYFFSFPWGVSSTIISNITALFLLLFLINFIHKTNFL